MKIISKERIDISGVKIFVGDNEIDDKDYEKINEKIKKNEYLKKLIKSKTITITIPPVDKPK